jgi:hypothetical protein
MYASRRRLLTRSRRRAGRDRARRTRRKTMVRASRERRQRDPVRLPAQRSSLGRRVAASSRPGRAAAWAPPPATRQITVNGMLDRCAESRNEPLRARRPRCYPPAAFSRRPTRSGPASPSRPSALFRRGSAVSPGTGPVGPPSSQGSGSPHLWMGVWICRLRRVRRSRRVCRAVGANWSASGTRRAGKG